jgi:hypothetical protein
VRSYAGGKVANLEIKRKHKEVILKSRVAVAAADLEEAVYGGARPIYDEPDQWQTLEGFGRLMYETGARPQNIVRYEREAEPVAADPVVRRRSRALATSAGRPKRAKKATSARQPA